MLWSQFLYTRKYLQKVQKIKPKVFIFLYTFGPILYITNEIENQTKMDKNAGSKCKKRFINYMLLKSGILKFMFYNALL